MRGKELTIFSVHIINIKWKFNSWKWKQLKLSGRETWKCSETTKMTPKRHCVTITVWKQWKFKVFLFSSKKNTKEEIPCIFFCFFSTSSSLLALYSPFPPIYSFCFALFLAVIMSTVVQKKTVQRITNANSKMWMHNLKRFKNHLLSHFCCTVCSRWRLSGGTLTLTNQFFFE